AVTPYPAISPRTRTPADAARSSEVSTRIPLPSPMLSPGRPLVNGRAGTGDSASIDWKPANVIALKASVPPANTASAAPRRMRSAANPSATVLDEQAVLNVKAGPNSPKVLATTSATAWGTQFSKRLSRRRAFDRLAP